ncbi:MAG: ParA family protein [Anaerolineae bacterium]
MARIYAFANQKGGVGKTTTAVNLGAYLAARDKRTLLVDVDPQANATSSLGVDKNAVNPSVYHALIQEVPLDQIILLTHRLHLDLVPSSPALAGAEVEMVPLLGREYLLQRALAPVRERYDYILVDCPPSLGLLTINALTAADGVIIPIQCEYLPLEGLSLLLRTINLVRERLNPRLTVTGMVMTMHDARTNLSRQVVEEVQSHFPQVVFNTVIPRSVRLSEAPSYGETILSYAPGSAGALAYEALTDEVLHRDGDTLSPLEVMERG